jgi:hypothetical protein
LFLQKFSSQVHRGKTKEIDGIVGLGRGQEQKTIETDGNVGFGMGQETENDRD